MSPLLLMPDRLAEIREAIRWDIDVAGRCRLEAHAEAPGDQSNLAAAEVLQGIIGTIADIPDEALMQFDVEWDRNGFAACTAWLTMLHQTSADAFPSSAHGLIERLLCETETDHERTMGRKKLWTENVRLPLSRGTKDRIAAVLRNDEERTAFIREAIEREVERRTVDQSVGLPDLAPNVETSIGNRTLQGVSDTG